MSLHAAALAAGNKRARARLELHNAVLQCNITRLKALVDGGAALTELDEHAHTPIHLAVVQPDQVARDSMVSILVSGSDIDERQEALCRVDDFGMTPFHLAAKYCDSRLMDKMLDSVDDEILEDVMDIRSHRVGELWNGNWGKKEANGELAELDVEHMTMLHIALERLVPDVEDEDDDDADGPGPPISEAARTEAIRMITTLLARGADVNARDADARAPIHQAVGAGLHDVAKLLLEAGANPSLGSKGIGMTNTVLHQAVQLGDDEMVRLLLRSYPQLEVDAAGQNGLTPLCLAARSNREACARALVEAGADPKAVTKFMGKSALDIARANDRAALVKLFGGDSTAGA